MLQGDGSGAALWPRRQHQFLALVLAPMSAAPPHWNATLLPTAITLLQVAAALHPLRFALLDASCFEGLEEPVAVGAMSRILQAVSGAASGVGTGRLVFVIIIDDAVYTLSGMRCSNLVLEGNPCMLCHQGCWCCGGAPELKAALDPPAAGRKYPPPLAQCIRLHTLLLPGRLDATFTGGGCLVRRLPRCKGRYLVCVAESDWPAAEAALAQLPPPTEAEAERKQRKQQQGAVADALADADSDEVNAQSSDGAEAVPAAPV